MEAIKELNDKDYLAKIIGRYRKDFPQIGEIKLEKVNGGLIDFALLQKVLISDYRESTTTLFAKIYDPKQEVIKFSMNIPHVKNDERFWYAAMHQQFWNHINIPSPILYDFVDKDNYKILLMEYWSVPSHDWDIVVIKEALNDLIEKEKEKSFCPPHIIKEIDENKQILSNTLESIINSMSRTVNEVIIKGTNQREKYKEINKNFYTSSPDNPVDYYLNRLADRLEKIILRQAILDGDITIDKAHKYMKKWLGHTLALPKRIRKKVEESTTKIKDLFNPLISDLLIKENLVYSQGDAYLHHFKFNNFEEDGKPIRKSGIFDSCHSILEPESLTKTYYLLSPLLDLDYKSVERFFSESLVHKENLKAKINNEKVILEKIDDLNEQYLKRSINCFDGWAVFEEICAVGREATDELINKVVHDKITDQKRLYENPYLPEFNRIFKGNVIPISFSKHKADYTIDRLTDRIKERLEKMISKETRYELDDKKIKTLEQIKEFSEDIIFKANGTNQSLLENTQRELKVATG